MRLYGAAGAVIIDLWHALSPSHTTTQSRPLGQVICLSSSHANVPIQFITLLLALGLVVGLVGLVVGLLLGTMLGEGDGLALGIAVGRGVGKALGDVDGLVLGPGLALGPLEGLVEGVALGGTDGLLLGMLDEGLGDAVSSTAISEALGRGAPVGGASVGSFVGAPDVGASVGVSVGKEPQITVSPGSTLAVRPNGPGQSPTMEAIVAPSQHLAEEHSLQSNIELLALYILRS